MTKKFGVIAVGGNRTHQESYAREFAADPRCELVGVADEPGLPEYREGLNRLLASELGVPYLTLDEALARDDVQIIDNCADVERRARVAVKTLEAGKHLYMDKPLAGSVEDAKAIADAADKSDAVTQMFTQVTTSWAQSAKSAVESGQTGEVLALHCDMLMAKGKPGSVDPRVVRREKPSDGTFTHVEAKRELFDMGVYPVALVQWLSGARTKTVYGITGNYFFREHADLDIEDFGALALTLDSGQVASITSGRIGFTSHPRGGLLRITLVGENGIFTFSESAPYIEIYNDQPPFEMPLVHPFDPMSMWASTQREMQHMPKDRRLPLDDGGQGRDIGAFVDCVESGERPQVTVQDAAHHIEVIMAGYESAATGGPVDIG